MENRCNPELFEIVDGHWIDRKTEGEYCRTRPKRHTFMPSTTAPSPSKRWNAIRVMAIPHCPA